MISMVHLLWTFVLDVSFLLGPWGGFNIFQVLAAGKPPQFIIASQQLKQDD